MARRIAASSIQWGQLAERVPPSQKVNFAAFKMKSDGYLRRVLANPAELPKIDWNFYKNSVPIAGMVDNFQKQYEALKVPYPADTLTSQVEAQGTQVKAQIEDFVKQSNKNIESYKAETEKINAMLPYSIMTIEEYLEAHPEEGFNPEKPSFWPHGPEDFPDHEGEEKEEHH